MLQEAGEHLAASVAAARHPAPHPQSSVTGVVQVAQLIEPRHGLLHRGVAESALRQLARQGAAAVHRAGEKSQRSLARQKRLRTALQFLQ